MTGRRAATGLLAAAAVGAGAWRLAVLAGHWGQAAYAMPLGVVVVAAAALAAALVAAVVTVRAGRPDVVLLGVLTTGLLAYRVLGCSASGCRCWSSAPLHARRWSAGWRRPPLAAGLRRCARRRRGRDRRARGAAARGRVRVRWVTDFRRL
jgi:hypothetical protein